MRALAAALTMVAIGLATALPAAAQGSGCDATVADPDGLMSSTGIAAAERAAELLVEAHGVMPRARTIATPGTVDLDQWALDQLDRCRDWQGADGAAAPDLLLLVIAVEDGEIGSYFGTELSDVLDVQRRTVHAAMAVEAGAEEYGQALAVGMDAYRDALTRAATEAEVVDGDTSSGGSVLPWFLGGAAVVGAGAAGAVTFSRRRRRVAVQAEAKAARTAAMSAHYDLEQRWETIDAGVTVMTQATSAEDGVVTTILKEADEAEQALADIRTQLLGLPDPDDQTTQEQVDEAVRRWATIVEQVDRVRVEVDEVEAAVTALQEAKAGAPARIAEAEQAIVRADQAIAALAPAGHRAPSAVAWLEDARRGVAAAKTALGEQRFGDAMAAATSARERATQAATRAGQVPELSRKLPTQVDELERAARAASDRARSAEQDLADLRGRWHRTLWDELSDAPERASDLVEEATDLAADAREAIGDQQWDDAIEALRTAHERLATAEELATAPKQRQAEAEQALADARARLGTVNDELSRTRTLLSGTRADVDALSRSADGIERQLAKAEGLLGDRPDPIRAVALLDAAATAAARTASQASEAVAAWDRARDDAERQVTAADRKIREADRAEPRRGFARDVDRAEDLNAEARRLIDRDPVGAGDRARRAQELATSILRDKRRRRDRDRDDWRATAASTAARSRATRTRRTSPSSGGSVLGGSPSRPAPRPSPPSGGFGGGGSTKHGGFGGGGSSKEF